MNIISPDRVRDVFDYLPETGEIVWKNRSELSLKWNNKMVGKIAGTKTKSGVVVSFEGNKYFAHRIVWCLVTGQWPCSMIDHKDTNNLNNRFANLRLADYVENGSNSRLSKTNTSGYKGVSWNKAYKKWIAKIHHNKKTYALGKFETALEAHIAYCKKSKELRGEFHNPG